LLLVLLAVFALLASACGGDDSSDASGDDSTDTGDVVEGQPVDGGTLRVVVYDFVEGDPHLGSANDHAVLYNIYDRLFTYDPDELTPEPGLAKSFDYPDPLSLVIELQDGVTFHDGTPFDAEAVKFNIERGKTLEKSAIKNELSSVTSVEVTGPLQVTLHLSQPDASIPMILADRPGMMVSPTAAQATDGVLTPANLVGAGAFKVASYVPGDRIDLVRYDGYWQADDVHLAAIDVRIIADAQTAQNALLSGDADIQLNVPAEQIEKLESTDGIETVSAKSLWHWKIYPNFASGPFSNPKFREAVSYALNREGLNEAFQFGLGEPSEQLLPSGHWAHDDSIDDRWPTDGDQDKARALLEEAGLAGTTFKAIVLISPGSDRLAELVQANLKEVGLNMEIEILDAGAGIQSFFTGLQGDMLLSAHTGRPDPSQAVSQMFLSGSTLRAGTLPVATDELATAARAATDRKERADAFEPLWELIYSNLLEIPLINSPITAAMQDTVGGFEPNLLGKPVLTYLWINP
jgi:peptide/nickel transport system permease protein/peptide/nickel transport system substrate-binding protein